MSHHIKSFILKIVYAFAFISNLNAQSQDLELTLGGNKVTLKKKDSVYAVTFSDKDTSVIQTLREQGLKHSFKTLSGNNSYALYNTTEINKINKAISDFNASSANDALSNLVYEYDNSLNILKNEFIVKFKDDTDLSYINRFFARKRIKVISQNKYFSKQYLITFDGRNALSALRTLPASDSHIEFIEPNLIQVIKNRPSAFTIKKSGFRQTIDTIPTSPNDTLLRKQWYLSNPSLPHVDVNAFNGWKLSTGSPEIKIAIVDEGVDIMHPDLSSKIFSQFDAVENDEDQQPQNNAGHGTSCAGIAAAATNNVTGVSGIAWNCQILPIRIAKVDALGRWQTDANIIANGIMEAVNRGARVLSCSWGGGSPNSYINNAIDYAINKNCILVFAAGNKETSVNYPGNLSLSKKIITVSASNEWDEIKSHSSRDEEDWWGSNFGPEIVIAAPGVHMTTTDIHGQGKGYDPDSDYVHDFNGTSSATPLVAGTIALMLSIKSNLTVDQVLDFLKKYSDDLGSPGFDNKFGYGRLNTLKLLNAVTILNRN